MVVMVKRNQWAPLTQGEIEEMIHLYVDEDWSMWRIGKALKHHHYTVRKVLSEAGIELKRKYAKGEKHGSWKGGRFVSNGYAWVRISPDDPYYSMTKSSNAEYVQEHRYVMAQHLGRTLKRGETVHHIDGNKLNNDIENLQLRHGQHGNGIVLICNHCGSTDITKQRLK